MEAGTFRHLNHKSLMRRRNKTTTKPVPAHGSHITFSAPVRPVSWREYKRYCSPAFLTSRTYYPVAVSLPKKVAIPFWATQDPSHWVNGTWDLQASLKYAVNAKSDVGNPDPITPHESPGPPNRSKEVALQFLGGFFGGVCLILVSALLRVVIVRWRHRRRKRAFLNGEVPKDISISLGPPPAPVHDGAAATAPTPFVHICNHLVPQAYGKTSSEALPPENTVPQPSRGTSPSLDNTPMEDPPPYMSDNTISPLPTAFLGDPWPRNVVLEESQLASELGDSVTSLIAVRYAEHTHSNAIEKARPVRWKRCGKK